MPVHLLGHPTVSNMATRWMSLHLHWSSATFFSSCFESCVLNNPAQSRCMVEVHHDLFVITKACEPRRATNMTYSKQWGSSFFALTHGKHLTLCCGIRLQDVSTRPFKTCTFWGVDRIGQICPAHPTDARLDCDQHLELILVRGHRHKGNPEQTSAVSAICSCPLGLDNEPLEPTTLSWFTSCLSLDQFCSVTAAD